VRPLSDEARTCPGHADVAEAAFLFELGFVVRRPRMREEAFSRPAMTTTGNSSPLALCSVISHTRASLDPCSSSTSDSNERRSTNPPSDGSASRLSYSRAAETSSARFSMRPSGLLAALFPQVFHIAALVQHLSDGDRRRLATAMSVRFTISREKHGASDSSGARRKGRSSRPRTMARPQRVCRDRRLQARGQQAAIGVGVRRDLFDGFHHALADAARRCVDDAPQATSSCGLMTSRMYAVRP